MDGPIGGVAGASGPSPGARRPAGAAYGAILEEARTADWRGCGIEPLRYTHDRLDAARFLGPLLADPAAKVVIHRQALKIGQVPSIDGSRTQNVSHPDAKDFPGRVYRAPDGAFHIVGVAGEDWTRQTLHMLATAGVPAEKVALEGVFDPAAIAAKDLDATLGAHDFASVTIGTMGELSRAVERVLREAARPAHAEKVLAEAASFLESRVREARADRRPRWEEALSRLRGSEAQGGTAAERLMRVAADPVLRGPLAEHLRRAEDGPPLAELPMRVTTRSADVFDHRVLEVEGKKHLLVHIGGAHGDMAYEALRHILSHERDLQQVNMYGSCGSYTDAIPPDTFVLPQGSVRTIEGGRPAGVSLTNAARLEGALPVRHTNVSTLLREHRAGLSRLEGLHGPGGPLGAGSQTVDIEGYHVARAVEEANAERAARGGPAVEMRAILRVSDVATSSALGAHRTDREGTSDYDARRLGEERVVRALGLVGGGS